MSIDTMPEPAKPIDYYGPDGGTYYKCGNCEAGIGYAFESLFCKRCGKPVKW